MKLIWRAINGWTPSHHLFTLATRHTPKGGILRGWKCCRMDCVRLSKYQNREGLFFTRCGIFPHDRRVKDIASAKIHDNHTPVVCTYKNRKIDIQNAQNRFYLGEWVEKMMFTHDFSYGFYAIYALVTKRWWRFGIREWRIYWANTPMKQFVAEKAINGLNVEIW